MRQHMLLVERTVHVTVNVEADGRAWRTVAREVSERARRGEYDDQLSDPTEEPHYRVRYICEYGNIDAGERDRLS